MFKKIKYLIDYFKYLKNPIQALLFKFNIKKSYNAKVKGFPESFVLTSVFALNKLMFRLPFLDFGKSLDFINYIKMLQDDCPYVTVNGVKYTNIYNSDFKKK